jgi:predicted  nucleic acid-binding Zn-ribbon protein
VELGRQPITEEETESAGPPAAGFLLRQLHRLHTQRTALQERLERAQIQLQSRQTLVARKEQELAAKKEELKKLRQQIDLRELDRKVKENRLAELQQRLNECRNNREYSLLLGERKAQLAAKARLEDEILELMIREEEGRAALKHLEQELADEKSKVERFAQEVGIQQQGLAREIQAVDQQLVELEKHLPEEVRDSYRRLVRQRGSEAVAPVQAREDGTVYVCLGCYNLIPRQLGAQLRLGQWVQCTSCGRFLYLDEATV